MTAPTPDLTALISSRICHDLINPIGAISNGLELLETMGQHWGPELELVADSVANANAKLNYFRIAFGDAPAGAQVRDTVLERAMSQMFSTGRFKVQLTIEGETFTRVEAKLLMLLTLCMDSALPLGGDCQITLGPDMHRITGQSDRIKIDKDLWRILTTDAAIDGVTSSQVQFAVAADCARHNGIAVSLVEEPDCLTVSF